MSFGGQKRTRSERVAALELPPAHWRRVVGALTHRDVLARLGLAAAASIVLCAVIGGWAPPLVYRAGYAPARDLVARVEFVDPLATQRVRDRLASQVRFVYSQNPQPLVHVRTELRAALEDVAAASSPAALGPEAWGDFLPYGEDAAPPASEGQNRFEEFRAALSGAQGTVAVEKAVAETLAPFERHGFTVRPLQKPGEGNQEELTVYPQGRPDEQDRVKLRDILVRDTSDLRDRLKPRLPSPVVAECVAYWLWARLETVGTTLTRDQQATEAAQQAAADAVADLEVRVGAGRTLADAGKPLTAEQVRVLRLEHEAVLARRGLGEMAGRAAAVGVLIFAAFCVCGLYLQHRERQLLLSFSRLAALVVMVVATVVLMRWLSIDAWRAELVPLLIFAQTVAIAYRQELALLLCGVVSLIVVLGVGHGLAELLVLMGAAATAIAQVGRIRSRSKLVYVGLSAGVVAALMSIVAGVVEDQRASWTMLSAAARTGVWGVAAGFVMSGILPFIERAFGVLTDISLLELGDVAHPLLQELVRRAPSTYNHSVTVGSIAEAAAEAIGARGLLVRVGAYFHDIGKMLKPVYFIENQPPDCNQHASLVPAMSTLVIIAHVKDGTDLARQHHLPEPIIDFIRQHHGTTLVEYFYARASEKSQSDPNGNPVEESTYRYPGPKPQTREACVLMLADSVEGASRTLVDPTPARIESLVHQVTERRLEDEQFDESGLTLRELRTVQNSLVKSLTAIYHGRIKYPEQKTA